MKCWTYLNIFLLCLYFSGYFCWRYSIVVVVTIVVHSQGCARGSRHEAECAALTKAKQKVKITKGDRPAVEYQVQTASWHPLQSSWWHPLQSSWSPAGHHADPSSAGWPGRAGQDRLALRPRGQTDQAGERGLRVGGGQGDQNCHMPQCWLPPPQGDSGAQDR